MKTFIKYYGVLLILLSVLCGSVHWFNELLTTGQHLTISFLGLFGISTGILLITEYSKERINTVGSPV